MLARETWQVLAVAAGVEHIGHQQHIVESAKRDAMALKHGQIGLDVMPDLENAWVLEHGFEESERVAFFDLPRHASASGQKVARAVMAKRHIEGFAHPDSE